MELFRELVGNHTKLLLRSLGFPVVSQQLAPLGIELGEGDVFLHVRRSILQQLQNLASPLAVALRNTPDQPQQRQRTGFFGKPDIAILMPIQDQLQKPVIIDPVKPSPAAILQRPFDGDRLPQEALQLILVHGFQNLFHGLAGGKILEQEEQLCNHAMLWADDPGLLPVQHGLHIPRVLPYPQCIPQLPLLQIEDPSEELQGHGHIKHTARRDDTV